MSDIEKQPVGRMKILELLAEELLKANPSEGFIQQAMQRSGLPETNDPIERINCVLRALEIDEKQSPSSEEKNG